ncbi:ABC transporter ATP-binding protein [Fuscibacter oryzae]|uniref:sn-glycerol-3-phosphate ABC transporter ATP-binding protein UgpC n=1 Tax=Fuscibacter oryzae TaxID=2803939 RepID=A0A8J7SUA7_9RHOB|nr:sn-glycerol-3-phosphate ABC transporter ATP-binding protein UgpC [Fuscibacter oryzae]MBL4929420.1 sn-glycerol-3-phosphate ABC transporter ATP-binding protein UgpC [Fuscibacter oryzae]
MASVTVAGLEKKYGTLRTLHGVDVDIEDGSFVVLVGPSGCGKSTLLRMIAGLEDVSGGDIFIGDRRVNDDLPKDRDIAMVFQNYALYPHMTVRENMGFSLRLRREKAPTIASKVDSVAKSLALDVLLDRYPRELSGGQRQRVAMGRAIVRSPEVFLFDEPLSNLDAKLRVHMRAEIKSLHQRLRTTTIYVTHDQIEAMTMADKIVVMREGRVEQVGTPLDLYDRPDNMFVAGFIGSPSMNFIEGAMTDQGFRAADGTFLPLGSATTVFRGAAVYGIRPENLALAPEGIPMKVSVIEPTGAETQVFGSIAGKPVVVIARERVRASPGDVLTVAPEAGAVHLFDAQTTLALRN